MIGFYQRELSLQKKHDHHIKGDTFSFRLCVSVDIFVILLLDRSCKNQTKAFIYIWVVSRVESCQVFHCLFVCSWIQLIMMMIIVAALPTLILFGVVSYRFFLRCFEYSLPWCYVFVQILEVLLKHPENRECADCKTKYCFFSRICELCWLLYIFIWLILLLYIIFFAEVPDGLVLI